MKIGYILKLLRVRLKLSQSEMADKLGISQNYLSLLESDKREPSLEKIARFAGKLGISKDALLLACSDIPIELKDKNRRTFVKLQNNIMSILLIELTGEIGDWKESA